MINIAKNKHLLGSISSIFILFLVLSTNLLFAIPIEVFLDPTGDSIIKYGKNAEYPIYEEKFISSEFLKNDVKIVRDKLGIPHIYAEYDSDMFFAVGYLHAQDRLFQLDIQRRFFSGTLSEVLGNATLDNDMFMRTFGLVRESQKVWDSLQQENDLSSKKLVESIISYTKGINTFISENNQIPIEFQLLDYLPSIWLPVDTIAFGKYVSFALSFGEGYNDLRFTEVVNGLGVENAYELFPLTLPLQIPVIPDYGSYEMPDKYTFENTTDLQFDPEDPPYNLSEKFSNEIFKGIESIRTVMDNIYTSFGFLFDNFRGSNSWVVKGSKTLKGNPILANDPHGQWNLPSVWYQLSYHSKESDIDVWGFSYVGSPLIILGHNKDLAWGFTNVGADVVDWYYFNENTKGEYFYNRNWQNYTIVTETIKIKNNPSYIQEIKYTKIGPMISVKDGSGKSLVASWVGIKDYKTDLGKKLAFKAIYGFNVAKSFNEFNLAIFLYDSPAQNIILATKSNIALWVAGDFPIRPTGIDGRLVINGSIDNSEWIGYIKPEKWPFSINPVQKYLVSANQKSTGPDYDSYIGSYQADGYRARRINYLLNSKQLLDVDMMKKYQTDIYDTSAEAFIPFLLGVIDEKPDYGVNIDNWNSSVNAIKNWNFKMNNLAKAPLIFEYFIENYLKFTFTDEFSLAGITNDFYPQRVLLEYLSWKSPDSAWFDNKTSSQIETSENILITAFEETVKTLTKKYGNFENWAYQVEHKGYFEHLLSINSLSTVFISMDGSQYTINPSKERQGASFRAIYDLNNLSNSVAALAGGQNGNPFSSHYKDLLEDYFLKLDYYPQYFFIDSNFPNELIEATLILRRI